MQTKTKRIVAGITKWLTIISAGLTGLAGGLALLPTDSANLLTPPSWRPYLAGVALMGLGLSRIVVPLMEAIIKGIKAAEDASDGPADPPAPPSALSLWLLLAVSLVLVSCSYTVSPDGTEHYTLNGEQAAAMISTYEQYQHPAPVPVANPVP